MITLLHPLPKRNGSNFLNTDISKYSQGTDDRNVSIMVTEPSIGKLLREISSGRVIPDGPLDEQPALPHANLWCLDP